MEIVKEVVEYNQTAMVWAKLLPVIFGIILLILFVLSIREIMNQDKRQTKNEKIKKISIMLGLYIVAITVFTFCVSGFIKINAKSTSAKVEGEAVLQKYEDADENVVQAKLKGKDKKVINIRLDKAELLNQKDRIVRGDKVKVKSDKAYPLTEVNEGIDLVGNTGDNREKAYELKAGSELVKVD